LGFAKAEWKARERGSTEGLGFGKAEWKARERGRTEGFGYTAEWNARGRQN
jgi:hypothetical protein